MGSSVCNKLPLIKTRLFKQKLIVFFRSLKTTEDMDHCTILNILLENPEELDLKHKPSAIREDKIFTLDQRVIPIASAVQDSQHTLVVDSRQEKKQQNRLIESATKLSFNFICKLRITEVT